MAYSTATKDIILNLFKATAPAAWPATVYVALLTTNPSDDAGTGLVEVVNGAGAGQWNGYARQPITSATGWSAISGTTTRQISNGSILTYPAVSLSSGSLIVTGMAIYDAATVGTLKHWVTIGTPKTLNDTDTLTFGVGALIILQ